MKHQTGIWVFVCIAVITALSLPVVNLIEPSNQKNANELIAKRDWGRLAKTLFQGDRLASWLAITIWEAGISTNPEKVVIGYDGWLHLGDQYAKTLSNTRSALEYPSKVQSQAISEWSAWLRRQGVRSLVFMVGPNKSSVYPHTLPKWAKPSSGNPQGHRANERPPALLDLRAPLRMLAEETDHPFYYTTDTHWNQLGAAHAFVLLGEHLRRLDPTLTWPLELPVDIARQRYRRGGDLALFLRISHQLADTEVNVSFDQPERYRSTVSDYETQTVLFERTFAGVDFPSKTVHVHTPAAQNSRRVLWLRDSFGSALSPMMAAAFSETVQLHWHRGMKDGGRILQELVRQWQPHIVIFTVVERDAGSPLLLVSPPKDG